MFCCAFHVFLFDYFLNASQHTLNQLKQEFRQRVQDAEAVCSHLAQADQTDLQFTILFRRKYFFRPI